MDISVVYEEPSRRDLGRLAVAIENAVLEATGVDVEATGNPGVSARQCLTALHALRRARGALEGLEVQAALAAGRAGATYADLGAAVGITRQAARERWPGAVPDARPGRPRDTRQVSEEDEAIAQVRADEELEAALAEWPELAEPDEEPCEVWYPDPDAGDPVGDWSAWSWVPGVITDRVGRNEWVVEVGDEGCFRDLSEIRKPTDAW